MPADTLADDTKLANSRKPRRVGPDGKPMRRLTVTCTDADFGKIKTAIATRSSSLFTKAYGGEAVTTSGNEDEVNGTILALVCENWLSSLDK